MTVIEIAGEVRKTGTNYSFDPPQKGGESARILVQGPGFGADLADLFPAGTTTIKHHLLGSPHVFWVTTSRYTIEQFVRIATLYVNHQFDEVDKLVAELFPRRNPDRDE